MSASQLRLLGPPCVHDGVWQPMPINTPTSLLMYLAVAADWVSRRELAYLYRPDSSEAEALSYLRLQLHRAARYPWAAEIEVGKQQVRWLVPTDVSELRSHHAEERWDQAVAAYGGAFLSGLEDSGWPTFDSWLELERESCRLLYQEALREHASALQARGNSSAALDAYRKLLALDELDEPALRQLMRLTAGTGGQAETLRQFERFRRLLLEELGVEPEPETTALATSLSVASASEPGTAAIGTGEPAGVSARTGTPGATDRPAKGTTLPRATTKFVGRETELAQLEELLTDDDVRLVTLVGIGGTGKTRLATELARRSLRHFPGGVWFVPLVEVTSSAVALERIASAFGLDATSDADLQEELLELSSEPALIVLDNCEQVEGLSQLLSRLLAGTGKLSFLVTSRRTLDMALEHIYDVGGLSLPSSAAEQAGSDAADLFVGAARRVLPRLQLEDDDRLQVHRICRYVDGLPLALELASAWVRAMPLARIADELQKGFELLTTEQADVEARHRSVEAVLQRTWDSLTDRKASTLAAMAVFQDGCTLEAAESVTGGELPILLSLVNQSLLHRFAEGRFGCHPLVAQYSARALAADTGHEDAVNEAHAAYYGELLQRFSPDRQGVDAPSLRVLEPDIGNVEKAWFYLIDTGQVERLEQLSDSLLNYYTIIGQYRRGMDLGQRTLELLTGTDAVSARVRCSIRLAHCNMARESGLLPDALVYADAAMDEASSLELTDMAARAHRFRGDVLQMMGRFEEAEPAYEEAIAAFTRLSETSELANTLNSLASMDAVRERYDDAVARFEECVGLFEQVGDVLAKAIALNNLGYLADAMGQTDVAARRYEDSLADFERIQFTRGIAAVKNNLVVLYGSLGRLDEAEASGMESLNLKVEMEDRLGIIISLKNLGDLRVMRADPEGALNYFLAAMKLAIEVEAIPRLLQVLPGYATALDTLGRTDEALLVRTVLAQHPLTPPSIKDSARAALPFVPQADDQAAMDRLAAKLELELADLPTVY